LQDIEDYLSNEERFGLRYVGERGEFLVVGVNASDTALIRIKQ